MKKKLIATCTIVFILIIVSIASILFLFYERIHHRTSELYNDRIELAANLNSQIMETKLYTYINVISATAETMQNCPTLLSEKNLEKLTAVFKSHPDFLRMGIGDNNGNVWYTDGNVLNISDTKNFKANKNGNIFITDRFSSILSPDDVFIISVPIIGKNNVYLGHVQGTIAVNSFQKVTSKITDVSIFKASIIDSNFNYILHVDDGHIHNEKNFKKHAESLGNTINEENLKQKINARTRFSLKLTNEYGIPTTIYYTPLRINDWYLLTYFDNNTVDAHIASILDKDVYYLVVIIMIIIICLVSALAYYYYKANKMMYDQEVIFRNQLLSNTSAYLEVNLHANIVTRASKTINDRANVIGNKYTKLFEDYVNNNVEEQYKEFVSDRLSLSSMLQSYDSGIDNISLEFVVHENNNQLSWRELNINFRSEPKEDEIVVFAYIAVRSIDTQKNRELKFKEKAERDFLTGLYNRDKGTELINEYCASCSPNTCAALAIFDVDNFKTLNDTLGHNAGDMALKDIANIMSKHFRQYDIVCRLAGDEFIVLLKDLPSPQLVNKILNPLLAKLDLVYGNDNNSVKITCSAGIAFLSNEDRSFDDLYVKADKALYEAKHQGRYSLKIYRQ